MSERHAAALGAEDPQGAVMRMGGARDAPALRIVGLSKAFAGMMALDGVDLDVRRGEIHALLGANGSGKSTLIKVLSGYHTPEPGSRVEVGGTQLNFGSTNASAASGLRFIHQDLGLIESLTVAENLALGQAAPNGWWVSERSDRAAAREVLSEFGIDVDPSARVADLRPASRTFLAIARALRGGIDASGLLVLDEPTASLPPEEVQHLFGRLMDLKTRGVTILYVTHRLPEVFQIADRVSILREGRKIRTAQVADLNHDALVELILGHKLAPAARPGVTQGDSTVLEVSALRGTSMRELNLSVFAGEVVGLTGLMGSGYEEALSLIFGAEAPRAGTVVVGGSSVTSGNPAAAIRAGVAFAPADRRRMGAVVEWSLRENLTLPQIRASGFLRWLSPRREAADAHHWLSRLSVTPADPERKLMTLSGGNQQRVVLARWLRCAPLVFLLDEPTFGVDAGAKRAIYTELRDAASAGAGVLVASSDTEELAELCDRVLIVSHGRIHTELVAPTSPDDIFAATLGASR